MKARRPPASRKDKSPGTARSRMEDAVRERTRELSVLNEELKIEIADRIRTEETLRAETAHRMAGEEELRALNRALKTQSAFMDAVIRIPDADELVRETCRILVEIGGYRLAWVGFTGNDRGKTVHPFAHFGVDGYAETIRISWGTNKWGRGPTGTAIRTGTPQVVRNISKAKDYGAWREAAVRHGFTAAAAIPLRSGDKVFGALNIYAGGPGAFGRDEMELLQEVAGTLAYGISSGRVRDEFGHAQKALGESEERFQSLVETLPVGICIVRDGRVVFANPEQEKLLRTHPGPAPSGPFLKVHPDDAAAFDALLRGGTSGEPAARDADLRLLPCGSGEEAGQARWVRCKAGNVRYEGRDGTLLIMMDISRAKELELLMAVREKLASLGQLSAGIAHEIRNPLSGINIYLSTLGQLVGQLADVDQADRDRITGILEQLTAASAKIARVIQRVMDFSKPTPPRLGSVNMNHVVEEAVRISASAFRKYGIDLSVRLAPDLPGCQADPHLIEQVLLNLINNAVQAMESRRAPRLLEIASGEENGRIVLRVSDSGAGVPVRNRAKIFDPFFTTRKEGYGIGLSFSHRVIAEHGGALTVGTSRWGGAEFRIEIPAGREESIA